MAVVNQNPRFSLRKIDYMSANLKVKSAIMASPSKKYSFTYATTTPQTLAADAVKHIGCQPLHLISRVISTTSTYRLSMLFAFEENGTRTLPKITLRIAQKVLDETREICYEGYRVCGTEDVKRYEWKK